MPINVKRGLGPDRLGAEPGPTPPPTDPTTAVAAGGGRTGQPLGARLSAPDTEPCQHGHRLAAL